MESCDSVDAVLPFGVPARDQYLQRWWPLGRHLHEMIEGRPVRDMWARDTVGGGIFLCLSTNDVVLASVISSRPRSRVSASTPPRHLLRDVKERRRLGNSPDSREAKPITKPRDNYIPYLHIDTLTVKAPISRGKAPKCFWTSLDRAPNM